MARLIVGGIKSTAIAGVSVDNIGSDMGKMLPMNDALAGQYGTRPRQHLADGGFAKLDDIEALAQNGVETFVPVPKPRNADRDRHAPQPSDPPGVADWRNRMGGDDAKTIYKERAATAECANAQARNRGLTQFLVRSMDKVQDHCAVARSHPQHGLHVASDAGISPHQTQRRRGAVASCRKVRTQWPPPAPDSSPSSAKTRRAVTFRLPARSINRSTEVDSFSGSQLKEQHRRWRLRARSDFRAGFRPEA